MSEQVRILLSALPCLIAMLCYFSVVYRWDMRNEAQRTMGVLMLLIAVGSVYFFIFRIPMFQHSHRLDWLLTSVLAFVPVTYYQFICRLTGTGTDRRLLNAYILPAVLSFITLILYMLMGDKPSSEYVANVKLVWPVQLSSMPLLWKVKFVFSNYIFKPLIFLQAIVCAYTTFGRVARFHRNLKEFFADAETKLFRSGVVLTIASILMLLSMMLVLAQPYSVYAAGFRYHIFSLSLLAISMILLTAYCLQQPITAEKLAMMSEETKNMGQAIKGRSSLRDRLESSIEDEFFTDPDVTIMSLSEKIGTNSAYLTDIIHVTYGMSFADFVNDLRIQKAVKEMREIPLTTPLTKVAMICGYTSYSDFAHNFAEFAHLTPSEWMKRYR